MTGLSDTDVRLNDTWQLTAATDGDGKAQIVEASAPTVVEGTHSIKCHLFAKEGEPA